MRSMSWRRTSDERRRWRGNRAADRRCSVRGSATLTARNCLSVGSTSRVSEHAAWQISRLKSSRPISCLGSWRLKDSDYKWGSAFSPRGLLMCGTSCRSMSWSLLPSSCSRKDSMIGVYGCGTISCAYIHYQLQVTSYKKLNSYN